jgi:hypothetical protein
MLLVAWKRDQSNERRMGEIRNILSSVSLREANDGRSFGLYVQHGKILCLYISWFAKGGLFSMRPDWINW